MTNEGNLAATETGVPIRTIRDAQSRDLAANVDVLRERTRGRGEKRGQAETPEDVGVSVQGTLRDKLREREQLVSDLYKRAERTGEMQEPVSPKPILDMVEATPDKTHLKWVKEWADSVGVTKTEKTGGITVESMRNLTLKELEDLRQSAVARAMDGGTEGFYAGKVIRAIDEATEGAGGNAYKVARAARRQQALDFEDPASVARLVENRSRTDRATALEDTWRKSVLGGSIADLNQVKNRLLLDDKSGAGRKAWRDMRAQTLEFIREEATRGSQTLPDGTRPFSAAGMEKALRAIGPQKLESLFGSGTVGKLQQILEAARITRTEPPRIHQGSSTVGNALAFLENSLVERVPYVGPGIQKARIESAKRQAVREAQSTPLDEAAATSKLAERQKAENNIAALAALGSGERSIRQIEAEMRAIASRAKKLETGSPELRELQERYASLSDELARAEGSMRKRNRFDQLAFQ